MRLQRAYDAKREAMLRFDSFDKITLPCVTEKSYTKRAGPSIEDPARW